MAGWPISAAGLPTPGPWIARGTAAPDAPPYDQLLGVEPATEDGLGGPPYLIRRDQPVEPSACPVHLVVGIPRLADARLLAAAPDLAAALLDMLIVPELDRRDLDPRTQRAVQAGWDLLVRVAPHLEFPP